MLAYFGDRKFRHATVALVGTMVGAGIFGIPFVFAKAGFWVGTAHLVVLTLVTVFFNLIFAELVLRTNGTHQLPGYANIWMGAWAKRIVLFCNIFGIYGALLAYLILVGEFLHTILSQFIAVDPQLYSIVFAVGWSLFWLARIRTIAAVEQVMAAVLGVVMIIIVAVGLPHITWTNFSGWTAEFWFLPYGVIMFALAGLTSVPIMRQLLQGSEKLFRPSITWAVGAVAVVYFLFAFVVVGVSGEVTSPEALAGLYDFLGSPIVVLGSLLGVLTVSTSYLMLGTALFEIFAVDYKVRPVWSWLLAVVPPLALFASGLRSFIDVIGIVGAVAIGVESCIFLMAYLRSRRYSLRTPEFTVRAPAWSLYVLTGVFLLGSAYALVIR